MGDMTGAAALTLAFVTLTLAVVALIEAVRRIGYRAGVLDSRDGVEIDMEAARPRRPR